MSLGFGAPLWLLALLGLAVPLVLHLLARGRGRRVRVGSVRLLTDSPPRRPRRLQLQRPLLLALRCLLLALVALALAAPRLRRDAAAAAPPRPWVLLDPAVAVALAGGAGSGGSMEKSDAADARDLGKDGARLDAALPPRVRAAIRAGAEVRLLATGLPPRAAVADPAALPDVAAVAGGTWSLLREAAATAPPGARLLVVSSGRLAALRGERPRLANAVEWFELPDPRPNRWAARAQATPAGSALLVGVSDPGRTRFERHPVSAGTGVASVAAGDFLPQDDRLPLATPRSIRVALLAAADRTPGARYLRAALGAAAEEGALRVEIIPAAGAASGPPPDVAFWLADAPPPAALLAAVREGALLVTDARAGEESCGDAFRTATAAEPVALHRCVAAEGAAAPSGAAATARPTAAVVWRTDGGRALLSAEPLGKGRWLRFASRFEPSWSDLVLSAALPEWLRDLLRSVSGDATAELAVSDRRVASGEGRPASLESSTPGGRHSPAGAVPGGPPPSPAPEHAVWLLLVPLLLAERWLASRS